MSEVITHFNWGQYDPDDGQSNGPISQVFTIYICIEHYDEVLYSVKILDTLTFISCTVYATSP